MAPVCVGKLALKRTRRSLFVCSPVPGRFMPNYSTVRLRPLSVLPLHKVVMVCAHRRANPPVKVPMSRMPLCVLHLAWCLPGRGVLAGCSSIMQTRPPPLCHAHRPSSPGTRGRAAISHPPAPCSSPASRAPSRAHEGVVDDMAVAAAIPAAAAPLWRSEGSPRRRLRLRSRHHVV